MIEAGRWRARGCEAALGTAQSSGNTQVGVDLEILEGPSTGGHITWYGYFSDAAFEITMKALRCLGWEGIDLTDLSGIGRNEVLLTVDHEADEQTGEIRVRAQWINPLGGVVMGNRLDPAAAKVFAAQMRGRVLASDQRRGTLPVNTSTARPAASPAQRIAPPEQRPTGGSAEGGPADDNIPF
jgi:hypothetical protein